MNTKQVNGETIRLTKSGAVNKQDVSKLLYSYVVAIESAVRSWEFVAGMDGMQSESALKAQSKIDTLKNEYEAAQAQYQKKAA